MRVNLILILAVILALASTGTASAQPPGPPGSGARPDEPFGIPRSLPPSPIGVESSKPTAIKDNMFFDDSTLPLKLFEPKAGDDEVTRLLKARILALRSTLTIYLDRTTGSVVSELPVMLDQMCALSEKIADCSVELFDEKDLKIAALRRHLKLMQRSLDIAAKRRGQGAPPESYYIALAGSLDAELKIARLERSQPIAPSPTK